MAKIKSNERIAKIMERTMFNLQYVKDCAGGENGPYEVTQLVNSFLGALAHPWEDLKSLGPLNIKSLKIDNARKLGLCIIEPTPDSPKQSYRNYGDMLRVTRNAFAHGNLEFGDDDKDITDVTMCSIDKQGDTKVIEWCGHATISELEAFIWTFYDLANGRYPFDKPHEPIFATAAD